MSMILANLANHQYNMILANLANHQYNENILIIVIHQPIPQNLFWARKGKMKD